MYQACSKTTAAQSDGSPVVRTRYLEVQGNVYGMVLDMGLICRLTRCQPGLASIVAIRGSYGRGQRSILTIPPTGTPRLLSKGAVTPVFACTCAGHLPASPLDLR